MTKEEIIARFNELLQNENVNLVSNDVKVVMNEYLRCIENIKREQLEDFVAAGGNRKEYEYSKDAADAEIENLIKSYKEKKKKADLLKQEEERKNLEQRKNIILSINKLVNEEENIGKAILTFRDLQEQWKNAGAVSSDKYKDVQSEYSKAVESFQYNLNIYKDLQQYDLKRNAELKLDVISKLSALATNQNIKEVEALIKIYRNDWEEIGPVGKESWPELKEKFAAAMDAVYVMLKAYYTERKEKAKQIVEVKAELCTKVESVNEALPNTVKGWNNRADEIKNFQDAWKKSGKGDKKKDDELYKRFRAACDLFFEQKAKFFADIKSTNDVTRTKKSAIIDRAEALKDSTDWKNTANELIKLQKDWQQIESLPQHLEQKLWSRFRIASNHFFDARKAFEAAADEALKGNLVKKEAYLKSFNELVLSGDHKQDRETLKKHNAEWNELGHVPFNDKKRLNDAFYAKLDELYSKLNVDDKEKNQMKYTNKLDKLVQGDSPEKQLSSEFDFLKRKIEEIKYEKLNFENNLGFLKNAPSLRTDVEAKIAQCDKQIAEFTEKSKIVSKRLKELKAA